MEAALPTPESTGIEATLQSAVLWLQLATEAAGAAVVAVGLVATALLYVRGVGRKGRHAHYAEVRLALARYLALALEFQLASDVLGTAIAPSWDQIGKLAAIAVIRTVLNFFLEREMRDERREVARERAGEDAQRADPRAGGRS